MFPKDSIFLEYKKFANLRDLMVHADPYSIKPSKEVDGDPGCSDCVKRCDLHKKCRPYIIF